MFGGFAHPAPGEPRAGQEPVQELQGARPVHGRVIAPRRSSSFLGALALTNFGIASPTALKKYKANAGTRRRGRRVPSDRHVRRPSIRRAPARSCSVVDGRQQARARPQHEATGARRRTSTGSSSAPISDNAARLQALQSGEIQGYDLVDPNDIKTIQKQQQPEAAEPAGLQRRLRRHQPGVTPMNKLRPPGARLRPGPRSGRQGLLRRPRRRREPVPAEPGRRLRQEGRPGVPVQPGQGEGAPEAGGPDAAGADHVLVPDERLAAVHAGPAAERAGVRHEPREVGLQGHLQVRAVAAGLPGRRPGGQAGSSTCSAGRVTSVTRPTS